jgi:hypothetical protein
MQPFFRIPEGDPSTNSRLVAGEAPNGKRIVSVIFGMSFDVARDGKCSATGYEIAEDYVFAKVRTTAKHTKPSILLRDTDLYAWRNFTDVVVQGVARSDKPARELEVELSVERTKIARKLHVTGDRYVDRVGGKLVASEPEAFTEMVLGYENAYGGTDEEAENHEGSPALLDFFTKSLDKEENEELSIYSYPRNPAGKGYLVHEVGAVGTPLPNLEFEGDRLRLSELVKPHDHWGERPFPACFDWFSHAWFPRSGFLDDFPMTHDGKLPLAERALGLFEPDYEDKAPIDRAKHGYANGAHPYLARERLEGREKLRVTRTSTDGRDFVAALPGLEPSVSLKLPGEGKVKLPGSLDLVLLDTEAETLTLLYRATHFRAAEHLPHDWMEKTEYRVDW